MSSSSKPVDPVSANSPAEEERRERYRAAAGALFEEAKSRGEFFYLADALAGTLALILANVGNLIAAADVVRRLGYYLYDLTQRPAVAGAPPEARPEDATLH